MIRETAGASARRLTIGSTGSSMSTPILEMKNITKTFPGVKALSNVTFSVAPQEIHCLVGRTAPENRRS